VNRIQIHSNFPALCFGTPLISTLSCPTPLPPTSPNHAHLRRGWVWSPTDPHPPPRGTPKPPPTVLAAAPASKGAEHPPLPPFSSSHHFFPNRTPHEAPPLPLFLLSTLVPKAATVPPVLEPPRQPIPFSRELLPLEPPITDWLVPLSPLHSLRLLEHLIIVADHHGSPERRRPEALLRLTDDRAPQ
jgi:hypothetical protein